jgi:dipeptidyl aminopeptidase/acylaminoacyl peptidase
VNHTFTVDDLWALPRVGAPAPAPDGRRFIVPVTTYSMESNEGTTRLWLLPEKRLLTTGEGSQPAWSPDGSRLAFVRKPSKDAKPQIHLLRLDGGEPERLTDAPLGAGDPRFFADGRRLAFIAPVFKDAPTLDATRKRATERDADPVKAHASEERVTRYWDHWLTDGAVHHVFAIDLATRKTADLTPGSKGLFDPMEPAGNYDIAPDGAEIAFSASRSTDPWVWAAFLARRGRIERLTDHDGPTYRPVYSPDGRWIVYGLKREIDFYGDRVRLVRYDRRAKRSTVLTEGWDRSAMGWRFADARTIVFRAETEARTAIYALDIRGGAPREIARGGTLGDPQPAGKRLLATLSTLARPPEVVEVPSKRPLTGFTRDVMKRVAIGAVEEDHVEGAGGDRVQMWIVKPPGFRKGRRYPLVHLIHGGPHGVFGDEWHWRWNAQVFAAAGYLCALVNFHGSTSWGDAFTRSIQGRWGDQPYADVLAATDRLVARGLADPKRMAATGGSYGGYLAAWIASQTRRFACIVNHAGVSDVQGQWGTDVTQGAERSMGGAPWEHLAGMDRYSPIRHARGFRSPMLVLHGERDYRVPHGQAIEIYNVYKAMKLPARLVVYPDENHWILKPRNSRHWYGEFLAWLKRWMR